MDQVPASQPGREGQEADERVQRVLTEELGIVDSPETADRVVEQVERLAAGETQGHRADQAARRPVEAGSAVELAAKTQPGPNGAAAALTEAAAQAVASTPEAQRTAKAAETVMPPQQTAPTPEAERGRQLLADAMLRRMGFFHRLDTRIFLVVNKLPHPTAANVLADTVTVITTGGWIWLLGMAIARILGVQDSRKAFRLSAVCVIGATSAVEWPIKSLFRRKRPFIDLVRALVIGRRPDGYSFPSGHTAAAFSGAWIASTVWPRKAPVFFGLASTVGFSRVYVGAHYPGDVLAGASLGMVIAEAIRRPIRRFVR